jgi:hypothetical protein
VVDKLDVAVLDPEVVTVVVALDEAVLVAELVPELLTVVVALVDALLEAELLPVLLTVLESVLVALVEAVLESVVVALELIVLVWVLVAVVVTVDSLHSVKEPVCTPFNAPFNKSTIVLHLSSSRPVLSNCPAVHATLPF